jgi:hypothetical protein
VSSPSPPSPRAYACQDLELGLQSVLFLWTKTSHRRCRHNTSDVRGETDVRRSSPAYTPSLSEADVEVGVVVGVLRWRCWTWSLRTHQHFSQHFFRNFLSITWLTSAFGDVWEKTEMMRSTSLFFSGWCDKRLGLLSWGGRGMKRSLVLLLMTSSSSVSLS